MGARLLQGFSYAEMEVTQVPRKPKRPCSFPGCPRLTDGRFCPEHEKAWKRIRDRYMNAHPLCERCLKEGRYVKAEQVHHIKPLAEGGNHNEENLMSLCTACHAKIHADRGDRWHTHSDR